MATKIINFFPSSESERESILWLIVVAVVVVVVTVNSRFEDQVHNSEKDEDYTVIR